MIFLLVFLLWMDFGLAMWHQEVYVEEGEREGSQIFHVGDGWYYYFNRGDQLKAYYNCVMYCALGCLGRAIFHAGRGFRHSKGHEHHNPDPLYAQELALRRNILQRCRNLEYTPFSKILQEEKARFPVLVAARVTMAMMRTSMRNARLSNFPQIPDSLRGVTDLLRNPQYRVLSMTNDGRDNIYAGSVTDGRGDHHILLASTRMLRLMSRMRVIFSDGTFKIVPSIPSLRNRRAQVFNIVTTWQHHTIPLACLIMESRTEDAYTAVLTLLRNILPGWNFERVISDEEPAEINAWNEVFDPARIQNCLWHMCRAFVTHITVLRLGPWFHNEQVPQFRVIVRMACALPLLPAALLRRGWMILRRESRLQGGNFLLELLNPFFQYLWDQWVSHPRRRNQMSVFKSQHRTNNVCESLNSKMLQTMGEHPNIFFFLHCIVDLEGSAYTDATSLLRGINPSRARKTTAIANDRVLNALYEELQDAPMGIDDAVRRFLVEASRRVEAVMNQHVPRRN